MGKAEVTIPQTTKSSELDVFVGASHQRPIPRASFLPLEGIDKDKNIQVWKSNYT
jgi:hypothetical protein